MTKLSRIIGISLSILTVFFVTACDEDDMVGPALVDAYLTPDRNDDQGGDGDGDGDGGGY